jgi:hypothetical protein
MELMLKHCKFSLDLVIVDAIFAACLLLISLQQIDDFLEVGSLSDVP